VRDLSEHARRIGFEESAKHLVPALSALAKDDEQSLRLALAEQIASFATFLNQVLRNI